MINRFVKSKFIWVIVLSIIPLFDLLTPGLPVTHDGQDHVARIANFYASLSEGNIIPRWAANLNWGFGHPILMFLYPFSSYSASLVHFLGFSLVDSLKIVFGLGFIASGITMYIFVKEQFNEYSGVAAAALYLYAPYRFIDLYVRGAIGEHMAFIFPPLILYFILKFFREDTKQKEHLYLVGMSISFALLLLAHNAISLIFIPFIVIYSFLLAIEYKKLRKMFYVFGAFLLGFALSAFFMIPAFLEGKFTLRDIVTKGEYKTRFVDPLALLYGPWNYGGSGTFSVQLGILNIISLIVLPITILKLKKNILLKNILIITFIYFLLTIFVMLPQSKFLYEIITTLQKFQFPWRFLSFSVFAMSIFGAAFVFTIKSKTYQKIALLLIVILSMVFTNSYWSAKEYHVRDESFYKNVYFGTTDTGESAPIWSVRFMEKTPKARIEAIEGKAIIQEIFRNSTKHSYNIEVLSETVRIKDNTLYFPSWKVYANGNELPIQFQDPSQRGLITFTLEKGIYDVDVKFEDTKLRVLSNLISLIALFLLAGCFVYVKRNEK